MKKMFSYWGVAVILVLSYWSIASLFLPGFFPMHDDTQVARVFEMAKSLHDGMFPVRWVSDLGYGYGYPIFSFYGPFSYYLGGFISLLGANALLATKIMLITGMLSAGVGMYLLGRSFWGEYGGVIAGILYVYAPYHAVNLYVRGAVSELFGYAFVPFVFYGIYMAFKTAKFRYAIIASVAYASLLASHNLTGLMVTPFVILLLIFLTFFVLPKSKQLSFYFMFGSVFLGLLLSAFYWLPALSEMGYTNVISQVGGAADFREHFICLPQLWESQWGFGGSARGCIDGLSFRLGKIHIVLSVLALLLSFFFWRKEKTRALAISCGVFILVFSAFFSLEYSKFLWKALPVFSFIQYPWRFLMLMSGASSFLGGAAVWSAVSLSNVARKAFYLPKVIGIAMAIGVVFFYGKLFTPQVILQKTSGDYTNLNTIRTQTSAISDEYMPQDFRKPKTLQEIPTKRVEFPSSDARILTSMQKTQAYKAEIQASTDTVVHVNLAYFPAWRAFIDGKEIHYDAKPNGLDLPIDRGVHSLELMYVSTLIEKIGNMLSLIGIFMLAAGIIIFSSKRQL